MSEARGSPNRLAWHAVLFWSPEGAVAADVHAVQEGARELGSRRVNIDVSVERFEMPGGWAKRVVVHVQAASAIEARDAVLARLPKRDGFGGVDLLIDG